MVFPDHPEAVFHHGEGPQAKEVHLEQSRRFKVLHAVLRHDLGVRRFVQGNVVADVPRRDHHARRMHPGVSVHPLQNKRGADKRLNLRVGAVLHPSQVRNRLQRLRERADLPLFHRNLLRDGLHDCQGDPQNPADILQDRA